MVSFKKVIISFSLSITIIREEKGFLYVLTMINGGDECEREGKRRN